jgi:hypothetical protein
MEKSKMEVKTEIFDGMEEIDIQKVVNKKVTAAKRLWSTKKREIIKTDEITREENEIFKGDETLAMMVIQREQLETEIINYIDGKLAENR